MGDRCWLLWVVETVHPHTCFHGGHFQTSSTQSQKEDQAVWATIPSPIYTVDFLGGRSLNEGLFIVYLEHSPANYRPMSPKEQSDSDGEHLTG